VRNYDHLAHIIKELTKYLGVEFFNLMKIGWSTRVMRMIAITASVEKAKQDIVDLVNR